jgi:hypothetical protein
MKTLCKWSLGLIGALAIAGTVYSQQPPCANGVCTSDAYENTAMGKSALLNIEDPSSGNTAAGYQALYSNQTGYNNTAVGAESLLSNTASNNTALGYETLQKNSSGSANIAVGGGALFYNSTGSYNTASGLNALGLNFTGSNNTANGFDALYGNEAGSTGSNNTASGYEALYAYTSGSYNSAAGAGALYSNTSADYNTASGYEALYSSNAASNTASGYEALYANTSGEANTAIGVHALAANTTGSLNIAEGYHAGYNLTTGSNNIDMGSPGTAGDNATIKIGVQGTQTATFIAGIYDHSLTGSEVVVTSTGELGVVASSERFKTAIAPMGSNSAKLGQLRPVTFRLKSDATGTRQYGLIAEEVAKVYPELVIRDEKGRIDGVRYDELAPMLLNEVQKQAAEIRDLKEQQKQSVAQAEQLRDMQQQLSELHTALAKLQSKNELVAQQ